REGDPRRVRPRLARAARGARAVRVAHGAGPGVARRRGAGRALSASGVRRADRRAGGHEGRRVALAYNARVGEAELGAEPLLHAAVLHDGRATAAGGDLVQPEDGLAEVAHDLAAQGLKLVGVQVG